MSDLVILSLAVVFLILVAFFQGKSIVNLIARVQKLESRKNFRIEYIDSDHVTLIPMKDENENRPNHYK